MSSIFFGATRENFVYALEVRLSLKHELAYVTNGGAMGQIATVSNDYTPM